MPDRRNQPRTDHGGLPAPARPDDGKEAGSGLRLFQPGDESPCELLAPEEVEGVCLGERPEPLVGVPLLGTTKRDQRRGFECRAGRHGERIRLRFTRPERSPLSQLREGRFVRQQALDEEGEPPDVLRGFQRRAAPDQEVPEIGVPFQVEKDVGRSDVPVRDALAVGERERQRDLLDDLKGPLSLQALPSLLGGSKTPPAQVPRNDVGTPRLPPVVVDRGDVRMLQGGDRLGIRVEPTDELRGAGGAFVEDLDRHVPLDVRLDGAEHDPSGTVVDLLQEPVAAKGLSAQIESGILLQDPFVKLQELRGGIDTQLVRQDLPGSLERTQRLGLSPFPVVGEQQKAPEAFSPGVSGKEGLELPDRPDLGAACQQPFDPHLLGFEPKLIEPGRLDEERGSVGEVGKGRPAPHGQGVVERSDGGIRVHGEGPPGVPHQRVEPRGVQLGRVEPQPVTGCMALDPIVAEGLP